MKSRRVVKKIKLITIVMTILLIVVSFICGKTYTNHYYASNNYEAISKYISELKYNIEINNINSNSLSISSGNSILNIKVKSLNNINSYYKLLYSNDKNINIYYIDTPTFGYISSNDEISLKLFVSNSSDNSIDLDFIVKGIYNEELDNINIPNNYNDITNEIKVGDYISYTPYDKTEYISQRIYSGNSIDQNIYLEDSKYRILYINDDGTLDIISEKSLYIDEYNSGLFLASSLGYNNGSILLDEICNKIYGKSEYAINARNLNINDIIYNLKGLHELKSNEYSLKDIYYPYNMNNKELTLNTYNYGNTIINENYFDLDITEDNFNKKVYYDLLIDKKSSWLSSNYIKKDKDTINYGIYSIKNNNIEFNSLYNSLNSSSIYGYNIRPIVKLSSNINLTYKDLTWYIN